MPVRRPSRPDISQLIEALWSDDARERESAAARLAIIGNAAIPKLRSVVSAETAGVNARVAALRTLVSTAAPRVTVDAAESTINSGVDDIALEGIDVLRSILEDGSDDAAATAALEHLTALTLSTAAPVTRRLAALDALASLPASLLEPIHQALATDSEPAIAERVRVPRRVPSSETLDAALASGALPQAAATMAALVRAAEPHAPVTDLRRLVDLVRAREQQEDDAGRVDQGTAWRLVRGQVHQALARRGSRIALYDLRETIERTACPLSVDFLAAATLIADRSCLHALAERWVAASDGDPWLRDQLARAFRAIVEREALRRSAPELTRILARFPAASPLVATAPKTRRKQPRGAS